MAFNAIILASQVKGQHVEDPMHVVGFHSAAGPGVLVASLAVITGIAGSVALLRPRAARAAGAVAS
jgi:hypothetical protein